MRHALGESDPSEVWGGLLLANVGSTHGWLAHLTSRRLGGYAAAYVLCFGFVAVSGLRTLCTDGVEAGVTTATALALLALALLLGVYSSSNARRAAHIFEAANERLEAQLRHDLHQAPGRPPTATSAIHAIVVAELGAGGRSQGHSFHVLGVDVPPCAAMLWLVLAAATLAVCVQSGLDERGAS